MLMNGPKIKGELFGVDFIKRRHNDNHVLIELFLEDDEHWHKKISFSSYWIGDMIATLNKAKSYLEKECIKREDGYHLRDK